MVDFPPDNRFPEPGVDARFPAPGVDWRFKDFPSPPDNRFPEPGVDRRWMGGPWGEQPVVTIASGAGYAGSVLHSTVAGEWEIDFGGVWVPTGEYGTEFQVPANGDSFAYRVNTPGAPPSAAFQMWTPVNGLTAAQKTNGVLLLPEDMTVADGRVVSLGDKFGVRPYTQTVVMNQPLVADIPGVATATTGLYYVPANDSWLAPAMPFNPMWGIVMLQYLNGADTTIPVSGFSQIIGGDGGANNNRVSVQHSVGFQPSTLVTEARFNGKPVAENFTRPLPFCSMAFDMAPTIPFLAAYGRGLTSFPGRSWNGYFGGMLLLGEAPSAADQARAQGYMHWKHNIADRLDAAHPYRNAAPRLQ